MRIFLLALVSAAVLQSPTDVAIAKMSEAQRIHAGLYATFSSDTKILDARVIINRKVHTMGELIAGRSTLTVVSELSCTVEAVFAGQVVSKTVLPTLDGTFLFTDYLVEVTDVMRAPKEGRVPARALITRPGGFVEEGGGKVGISVSTWPLLNSGSSYVFFVTRVPQTGAYRTPHSFLFEAVGGSMKSSTPVKGVDDSDWYSGIAPAALRAAITDARCGGRGE